MKDLIIEYNEMTGSTFPTYPLLSQGEEEVVKILKDCLLQKKDVYQLGYLPDPKENLDIFY